MRWTGAPDGSVWTGGAEAYLAWRPGPHFEEVARRSEIREWEAFLSFDGGGTWAVRLTPHLSTDVRRIAVELPEIATDDARLLLRFGDEERELEVELPLRFRIDASRRERPWPARRAWHTGEAARPGLGGAIFWAEGDRDAEAVEQFEATSSDETLRPALRYGAPTLLAPARTSDPDVRLTLRSRPQPVGPRSAHDLARSPSGGRFAPTVSALLATCRLNL